MPSSTQNNLLPNSWSTSMGHTGLDELVYASNLLGADKRITNFGGGNTSVKCMEIDPLTGQPVEVLWVKGSGGDLGTATRTNFASLYQQKVTELKSLYKQKELHEDEMVSLYSHCTFGLNPTACSIDTPLHAFVPYKAVSHMHSDSVIAIAASQDADRLCEEIWKGEMGVLPWKRPGFDLGLMLSDLIEAQPGIRGALMKSHGFICWADTWEECFRLTIDMINQAQAYIDQNTAPWGTAPSGQSDKGFWTGFVPKLRGKSMYDGKRLLADINESPEVLDFLASEQMEALAKLGTSCPDHFLRTKIAPMVYRPGDDLDAELERFRSSYAAYYGRCKRPDSPDMRNPNPSVVLVPGKGMVSLGKSPQEARVTGEFYRNAIRVMKGAEAVSRYVALDEQEAFDIEYWQLEEAKLRRMPAEKDMSRQVAIVTGAAQGIGKATCLLLAEMGANVVLADIDEEKLDATVAEIPGAIGVPCNVTDPTSLKTLFETAILKFGGVDVCVVNAGNARRGTVADTSPQDYGFLSDLLMKAYFDTVSLAVQTMVDQGTGGSIVVVGSKNGVAVGSNAALYSAAKAFELHLMRSVAVDFAKHGVRCNAVNPDAVVIGSGIWNDEWRKQTAASLGIEPNQIESHYKNRTLLKVDVRPMDVAGAIVFLANERQSSRTTGCVITVDGGNREGFLR
ncbi:MAG: bifunctional rhamnulose-1-phosphate aldolase/short-chain dehydrogenase [Chthonomonadaceae bacterium]|nr:bifunctional rhamnulose-1-phosphate aldolase/short-chain dehydrogenase [Chthonomonadaceae bacterium]